MKTHSDIKMRGTDENKTMLEPSNLFCFRLLIAGSLKYRILPVGRSQVSE